MTRRFGRVPSSPVPDQLVIVGKSDTLRSKIPVLLGGIEVTMELDETNFPNGYVTDEVEIEVDPGTEMRVERGLLGLFRELEIEHRPSPFGKTATTFKILEGHRDIDRLMGQGFIHRMSSTDSERASRPSAAPATEWARLSRRPRLRFGRSPDSDRSHSHRSKMALGLFP